MAEIIERYKENNKNVLVYKCDECGRHTKRWHRVTDRMGKVYCSSCQLAQKKARDKKYKEDYEKQIIEEFCKAYKDFVSDESICDLKEDCSYSGGWCIDCFEDKWLKEQK